MTVVSRTQLKEIFKKVRHLRIPPNWDENNFAELSYCGWVDQSDDTCFLVTESDGAILGISGEVDKMPVRKMKHLCSVCLQHRDFEEVMLFTAKNKRLPKGIEYRVTGIYICADFLRCNREMKDPQNLRKFFHTILRK